MNFCPGELLNLDVGGSVGIFVWQNAGLKCARLSYVPLFLSLPILAGTVTHLRRLQLRLGARLSSPRRRLGRPRRLLHAPALPERYSQVQRDARRGAAPEPRHRRLHKTDAVTCARRRANRGACTFLQTAYSSPSSTTPPQKGENLD